MSRVTSSLFFEPAGRRLCWCILAVSNKFGSKYLFLPSQRKTVSPAILNVGANSCLQLGGVLFPTLAFLRQFFLSLRNRFSDTAVYPMYEILGWYTVGTAVTELDLGIQRQVRRTRMNRASPCALMWF